MADVAPLSRAMHISVNEVTCSSQVFYGVLVSVFGRCAWWVLSMNAGLFKIFHKDRRLRKCPDYFAYLASLA